jgi:hypothetical protein
LILPILGLTEELTGVIPFVESDGRHAPYAELGEHVSSFA